MTKLSVNINKVATLRNARGKNNPDVVKTALDLIELGSQGITIHPRPDERHIHRSDVFDLAKSLINFPEVEFNIEGYPSEDFLELIEEVSPHQTTLVPDPPHVITSNAGWRTKGHEALLKSTLFRLNQVGTRISVFIDPFTTSREELAHLAEWGAHRIELYTEKYAEDFGTGRELSTIEVYQQCAKWALELGMGINAGHDLDSKNLRFLIQAIPDISEVSIGHAFIADALYLGYQKTIELYLNELRPSYIV